MKYLYIVILTIASYSLLAQNYSISGILKDENGTNLEFATIMLIQKSDSALVSFARSEENGKFILENIEKGSYQYKITYVGLQDIKENLDISSSSPKIIDLGIIKMTNSSKLLNEVEIKAEADQVKIKKDTVEYNADSFKTVPNSNVEDLLKKLPGVDVEKDGSIKAQGEDVKNVYVNGKKFFGTDPKLATKNIQANMIKKVQIYDKKSDIANFTGIDDGEREKTINLEIKPEMSLGWFGNTTIGGGDMGRYTGKANINKFTPSKQLSLLALGNNTNQQGFTVDEFMNFSGQTQRNMRSGGGVVEFRMDNNDSGIPINSGNNYGFLTSWAGGINYNNVFNPKSELNGSYFYSDLNTINDKTSNKITFAPTGNFNTQKIEKTDDSKISHRLSGTYEWKIDSTQSLKFTGDANFRDNLYTGKSYSKSSDTSNITNNKIDKINNNSSLGQTISGTVLYRKKFAKKGRSLALKGSVRENTDDGKLHLYSYNYFNRNNNEIFDTLDQSTTQKTNNISTSLTANYTEPLGNRQYLEFMSEGLLNKQESDKYVFDNRNDAAQIDSLSNLYLNNYSYYKGGVGYRLVRKKYNFSTGINYMHSELDGTITSVGNQNIFRSFNQILPNARFSYDFSNTKRLNINYETNFREPSISQLQPVLNNSDPQNLSLGNPNLKPEYVHRLTTRFNSFNMLNQRSFFSNLIIAYTKDKIATYQTIDKRLVTTSQPINTPYELSMSTFLGMGYKIGSTPVRLNGGINGSYNYGFNTINLLETVTEKIIASGTIRAEYRIDDLFETSVRYRYSYNLTHYQIETVTDQTNITQTITADATYMFPFGITLNTSIQMDKYSLLSSGYNSFIPIWNAYISKTVFKNKKGEVRFSAYDMLNKNLGISRTTNINYIEDTKVASLARYFMLSFTYTLNSSPTSSLGPMGPGHGGRRMMF